MATVLVIDDDAEFRTVLRLALEDEDFGVIDVADAETGLYRFSQHAIDAVLVDVRLPGLDGLELCRELRRRGRTPIIAVSADGDIDDVVAMLDAGADDYVTKPVAMPQLIARVRSLLRRAYGDLSARSSVTLDDVVIALPEGDVYRGRRRLDVTPDEAAVLAALADRPNVVVSTDELAERVWGASADKGAAAVDGCVRSLQTKLERDPGRPQRLVAVGGTGYRLVI